ncbi:MAG: hypothetical protein WCB63_20085, partial [Polyangiales bacterium]
LNFSELLAGEAMDTADTARPIAFSTPETGTILTIPGEGAASSPVDVDWYTFTMPSDTNPNRFFETAVTIVFPVDPNGDTVGLQQTLGGSSTLIRRGSSNAYKVVAQQSRQVWIRLGSGSGDNVYRITVDEPQLATPDVQIVKPIARPEHCDTNMELEAEVGYPSSPVLAIPDGEVEWLLDGVSLGYGRRINQRLPVGVHELSVRAYGDDSVGDTMDVNVVDCPGLPPEAQILTPGDGIDEYASEWDANGYYLEVPLSALAYDRDAGGTVTVQWTTSHGDIQPGGATLATEANATVRLYTHCGSGFGTAEHEVVLTVEDEDENVAQDRVVVVVRVLC